MSCRTASGNVIVLVACVLMATITEVAGQPEKHQTGFYLVAAEASTADALPAPNGQQQIARYDQKYLRDSEREPPRYLLLSRRPDVTLKLAKPPAIGKGSKGFAELSLELTKEAAGDLERVSREHLGQRVAFVVDGEVVTTHKIRSVITGGQFRLSRCTDNACQYIFVRLTEVR
jgi:preprotein translocase subunit SecD